MIGPDMINAIRAGVAAGRTYSEIAIDLDISRNAVAGAVYRHAKDVVRPEGTATRRKTTDRRPKQPPRPHRFRKPAPVPVEPAVIECRVVLFTAASGCRWPLWSADAPLETKAVCGARCDGTYCAGHNKLAHRETKRRAA